jgi:DNA (cytosine-5)-methyltransferase 1
VVLEEVCAELEAEGYAVQPFIIPACAVNAPHRRDRVWIVANSDMFGHKGDADEAHHRRDSNNVDEYFCLPTQQRQDEVRRITQRYSKERIASNTDLHGRNECNGNDEVNASQGRQYAQRDTQQSDEHGYSAYTSYERLQGGSINGSAGEIRSKSYQQSSRRICTNWEIFPTQPPVCGGNDGIPTELDGITIPKWRRESIKGYGNAIVPQVALQIFKTIQQMED